MDHTFSPSVWVDGAKTGNRFGLALLAGLMATFLGALLWSGIALFTGPQSDYLSLMVALMVGTSVGMAGRGTKMVYGLLGVGLTLIGCFAGAVVAVIESGTTQHLDVYGVLARLDLGQVVMSIFNHATSVTYVFLVVSVVAAFQLSMRKSDDV